VYCRRNLPTFRTSVLLTSSVSKNTLGKQPEEYSICYLLGFPVTLKMEAVRSSETSVNFCRTTQHYISKDNTLSHVRTSNKQNYHQSFKIYDADERYSVRPPSYLPVAPSFLVRRTQIKTSFRDWCGRCMQGEQLLFTTLIKHVNDNPIRKCALSNLSIHVQMQYRHYTTYNININMSSGAPSRFRN
jgi:hypothetical protein